MKRINKIAAKAAGTQSPCPKPFRWFWGYVCVARFISGSWATCACLNELVLIGRCDRECVGRH